MSGSRCINQIFFIKIQSSIHIVLTKHQQLKIYKITIFNILPCIFRINLKSVRFYITDIIYNSIHSKLVINNKILTDLYLFYIHFTHWPTHQFIQQIYNETKTNKNIETIKAQSTQKKEKKKNWDVRKWKSEEREIKKKEKMWLCGIINL